MGVKRRRYTLAFKLGMILEYESGNTAMELSRKYGIHPNLVYRWRKIYNEEGLRGFLKSSPQKDSKKSLLEKLGRGAFNRFLILEFHRALLWVEENPPSEEDEIDYEDIE